MNFKQFITEEVGLRNIKSIVDGYDKCEIYFHKDLDGVTSALAMKGYLKTYYNIDTVDAHQIQYGGLEWAVKNTKEGHLSVLVDFAHAKPMFHIATDHHDSQVGDEKTDSTYYKHARSNVETISGEISHTDQFTNADIELIKTIDSADFHAKGLKPEDIQKSIFKKNPKLTGEQNRFMMGLVVNRLLLAYKNKRISIIGLNGSHHKNKNFLECLVLDSTPSLYSLYINIKHYVKNARSKHWRGGEVGLATQEELARNLEAYIQRMKNYTITDEEGAVKKGSAFDNKYKIIMQYGGGSMVKPGSYDRYVPFKNNPEANFYCIIWPMGLIQMSCNPFREKQLKGIHLGNIANKAMENHKNILKRIIVSLEAVKREYEETQDMKKKFKEEGDDYSASGFRFDDLKSFYGDCIGIRKDGKWVKDDLSEPLLQDAMDTLYGELSDEQKSTLRKRYITVWELIQRGSGGHPSITNLQGFGFLKYNKKAMEMAYNTDKYTKVMKIVARDMINTLKKEIEKEVPELAAVSEDFDFYLTDKDGKETKVDKEEFLKKGSKSGLDHNDINIDSDKKRIVAKFENFKNK